MLLKRPPLRSPYHALIASPRASPARSWQQMMRARLGIDKNNSWADWAEEEEEAAEPTKTLADAKYDATLPPCTDMMMTIEMILNETKKEAMETMGDASECVPATLMRQSDRHCARHTRYQGASLHARPVGACHMAGIERSGHSANLAEASR